MTKERRISTHLNLLSKKLQQSQVTWGEIHKDLGHEAPLLALIFLSVPFLQPIPLPAISTLLGLLMIFLGISVTLNKNLSLPKILQKIILPAQFFSIMLKTLSYFLWKTEHLIHPRGERFLKHPAMTFLTGIIIIISSFFLMLPLPPGFNFPPALLCFVLSLAMLEKDAVLLFIGLMLFLLEVIILLLALDGIKKIWSHYF